MIYPLWSCWGRFPILHSEWILLLPRESRSACSQHLASSWNSSPLYPSLVNKITINTSAVTVLYMHYFWPPLNLFSLKKMHLQLSINIELNLLFLHEFLPEKTVPSPHAHCETSWLISSLVVNVSVFYPWIMRTSTVWTVNLHDHVILALVPWFTIVLC